MRGLVIGLPLSCLLWFLIFQGARSLLMQSAEIVQIAERPSSE